MKKVTAVFKEGISWQTSNQITKTCLFPAGYTCWVNNVNKLTQPATAHETVFHSLGMVINRLFEYTLFRERYGHTFGIKSAEQLTVTNPCNVYLPAKAVHTSLEEKQSVHSSKATAQLTALAAGS